MSTGNPIIEEAKRFWDAGQSLDAGRIIFENIPVKARPAWAANILALAIPYFPAIAEVQDVLAIASSTDSLDWLRAHEAFSNIRKVTLRSGARIEALLLLAENTAKITYNSYGQLDKAEAISPPRGKFDADSGWWIAANARHIADILNDPEFTEVVWNLLIAPFKL